MKSSAFTILELVIVLIIVGAIAVTIFPKLERDPLREALNQIKRHIMFTQHMALVNDVYDASRPMWFKAMWRISFRRNNCYVVSSNIDLDTNYDREESVMDPMTKTLLYSNNKCEIESTDNSTMFLSEKFGIDEIKFSKSCGSNRFIAFDNLGRPHKTLININDYLKSDCIITFMSKNRGAEIAITPETGYIKSKIFD